MLISKEDWKKKRSVLMGALNMPVDPDRFIEPLLAILGVSVKALGETVEAGKVMIGDKGEIHIPPIEAMEVYEKVTNTRDAMFRAIGEKQLSDLMVEVDVACNFSEALLGRKADSGNGLRMQLISDLLVDGAESDGL
ncbi:hypothetical protein [Aquabacterium parvum]|uniref:hypothetical protein n=1 Tax=Aquabacterium parvum TaxID=70584 RepID=UPI0007190676|nr:hypothetical protein [Aquabacterium parvum]